MNKNLLIVLAAIVIGGALYLFVGSSTQLATGESIKIGFVGPLSGDGAAWGEIERNSIQLEVDKINIAGGINGRQINLIAEDGKCEGAAAVSAAQKLINVDKVKILFVSCSQEVLPVAPIAEREHVLVIASYAAASNISQAGDYVFRNSWTNRDMGRSLADEAYKAGKSVGIITETSEFATDLHDIFVADFQNLGGSIVSDERFVQGNKDVRSQVAKIIASHPDSAVVNPIGPATGLAILTQLKEQGYKGVIIGNFFGSSSEVQSASEAKGMIYVADPSVADSAEKEAFFTAYKTRFGSAPSLEWPAVARYDAVHILEQALIAVGDDPTKIKDYLYTMPAYTGLAGTYSFDSNGDAVGIMPMVAEIK